ncbi:PhoD-like phosphatase-domain-containing protein [Hysterangium stoloniferum]|nr:PhoD-like phosphatase-domain-containing protein [Hysterangium stoloniferum]
MNQVPSPRLTTPIYVLYTLYVVSWTSTFFLVSSPVQQVGVETSKTEKVPDSDGDSIETEEPKPIVVPTKPLPHGTFSTLVLSLPTSSLLLRISVLIINSLLLACTYDLIYQPIRHPASSLVFTRVGAVEPDNVKILVRWPEPEDGIVRVVWRQATPSGTMATAWKEGPLISLHNETDWVGVGKIGGLWPSTDYEYLLAYENATHLPYPESPIAFRTFPDPRLTTGNHFKFVASSCMLPNFPYLPFKGDRIRGFDLLNDYLWPTVSVAPPSIVSNDAASPREEQVPPTVNASGDLASESPTVLEQTVSVKISNTSTVLSSSPATASPVPSTVPTEFMILLGDFVYADVPSYGGDDLEAYRRLYRRMYASPSFRKVYERLPVLNIFDDHEFINNVEGKSTLEPPIVNASSAYTSYNGQANYDAIVEDGHYYDFRYGDVAFFVLDTRMHRSGSDISGEDGKKTMLGDKQLTALYEWLDRVNSTTTFKFIITSVPFTSLWTVDPEDGWSGYLDERDALLGVMGTIPNIFIISGDKHEFAAIEFLGGKVVEYSTSPLFYIPIVRTLRKQSKRLVEKWVQKVDVNEAGEQTVRNELEWIPEEKVLKALPLGNYKWSSFEVDTTDRQKPTLKVDVVINGRTEWQHTIHGTPVALKSSSALGTQITRGLKGALGKLGLSPTKWF